MKKKFTDYLIVDGYNVINAWSDLNEMAKLDKIETIKSLLLEKIDYSMSKVKLLEKMITSDSISLVFYQVVSEIDGKKIDPLYNHWKEIMKLPLEDTRNISEKIKS